MGKMKNTGRGGKNDIAREEGTAKMEGLIDWRGTRTAGDNVWCVGDQE
jgi:hypothetical protein